ncbi:MAG: hypothetical protein ACUVUR_07630, partial [bacterium]
MKTNPKVEERGRIIDSCGWFCFLILVAAVFLTGSVSAQFSDFGKNKVQTREYQFLSYETDHFNVIYYTCV